ncbi:MAG: J domain-containing protein [Acidimicrobiales bacterium]
MPPSLYDVLGVSPRATAHELRAAYLELAREAHPDRWIDSAPEQRKTAERRMQDATQAWQVLGDPGRRRRYDGELRTGDDARDRAQRIDEARFATRSDGTMTEVLERPDPLARLIRALPWIAVLLVLATIFVFSAYAATGSGSAGPHCVDAVGARVACATANAKVVQLEVDQGARCPVGTEALVTKDDPKKLCLAG